jgi:hypothetical protein
MIRLFIWLLAIVALVTSAHAGGLAGKGGDPQLFEPYAPSFVPGPCNETGSSNTTTCGGSEMRVLLNYYIPVGDNIPSAPPEVACATTSKTYVAGPPDRGPAGCAVEIACNDYWMDAGYYPQCLIQSSPNGPWLQDYLFRTLPLSNSTTFNSAVDTGSTHVFTINSAGSAINARVILAGGATRGGTSWCTRNDAAESWVCNPITAGRYQQGRSNGYIIDTSISPTLEYAFVGEDSGIFHGTYTSPSAGITWSNTPEPFCSVFNSGTRKCTTVC